MGSIRASMARCMNFLETQLLEPSEDDQFPEALYLDLKVCLACIYIRCMRITGQEARQIDVDRIAIPSALRHSLNNAREERGTHIGKEITRYIINLKNFAHALLNDRSISVAEASDVISGMKHSARVFHSDVPFEEEPVSDAEEAGQGADHEPAAAKRARQD